MHLLLRALADLDLNIEGGARLVIVGPGKEDYLRRLQQLEAKYSDRLPLIEWIGPVWGAEKWTYLQGADLFCLPTYSENFGIVVLEALQVGTPVLTTDTTPWALLEDWEAGYITRPETDAFKEALRDFFNRNAWSLQARKALAERTRQQFSWERIGPRYEQLYQQLANDITF